MDNEHFDAMTRAMAGVTGPRRVMLRLLAGGALAGLAARIGLSGEAEAKKHGKRHGEREHPGHLQAAGKGHKKHKNKHHPKPKDPQPQVCPSNCAEQGGRCCNDGSCTDLNRCCPDEKACLNAVCVSKTECCPEDRVCSDGSCVYGDVCCPDEKKCGADCIPQDECCELGYPLCGNVCTRVDCVNGEWECHPVPGGTPCRMPGPGDKNGTCCNGQCTMEEVTCPLYPWRYFDPNTCKCECPTGSVDAYSPDCDTSGLCCPASHPAMNCTGVCTKEDDATQWTCPVDYDVCPEMPGRPPSCCRGS
jgi:hypothetical protein